MAAGTASVDTMLADAISKMDALTKRMDALETGEGSKNPIKGDDDDAKKTDASSAKKADDDDDDDDKGKKSDATTPKNRILADDDEDKKKQDAVEVPPSPVKKGDSSRKKSDDGELEIKHEPEKKADGKKKADAAKVKDDDDDDDDKKDDAVKAKSDDDDDKAKKKDDAVKADAIGDLRRLIADQSTTIARLQSLLTPRSDEEHAAFAEAQAKADSIFMGFGERAPRPLEGEDLVDYRKRMATKLKKHSTSWKGVKLSQLPDSAFDIAENQIYSDAAVAAANPVDLEAGELREVAKVDPSTGIRTNVFYGKESFVKKLGRPGRRVASFRTLGSV
jgi:hypothetical protein